METKGLLSGRVVAVTGANGGIGSYTALALARDGAHVVLVCRNRDRGEVTRGFIEREAPGLAEAMRMQTLKNTPMAMISRGVCGIRSGTLIINLPGAPKAVRESFAVIAPVLNHAIALLAGRPGGDLH